MNKTSQRHAERRKKEIAYKKRIEEKAKYSWGYFDNGTYIKKTIPYGVNGRRIISKNLRKRIRQNKNQIFTSSEERKMYVQKRFGVFDIF